MVPHDPGHSQWAHSPDWRIFLNPGHEAADGICVTAAPSDNEVGSELLATFSETFPYMLVLLDPSLEILWASPSSSDVVGHDHHELLGVNIIDLLHPDDLEQITPMVLGMVDSAADAVADRSAAATAEIPVRVRTAEGGWAPVSASGRVVDQSGRLMAVVRPAAERHSLGTVLDRLAGSSDLQGVLESILDLLRVQFGVGRACLVHDFDGDAVVLGDVEPWGRGAGELVHLLRGEGPSARVRFDSENWIVPVLSRTQESVFGAFILASPRPEGPTAWDSTILTRTTGLASVAFSKARDTRLLEEAASTDYLTGVLNRRAFESSLAQLALHQNAFPVTLFFLDVDRFKAVNDRFGHRAGDETLIEVTLRLQRAIRPRDFIGRLGGDEFAICAPRLAPAQIAAMRSRLQRSLEAPIQTSVAAVQIGASVGTSTAGCEDDLERLIDAADEDMYRRKDAGRQGTEAGRSA